MKKYMVVDVETTGLNPMKDEIVAIGLKTKEVLKILIGKDEEEILKNFWNEISKEKPDILIGFNFDFDWQFIKLRSLKYRIKIKYYQKYKERYDLRLILNPNKYEKGTKLKDYLEFLDIPNGDKYSGKDIPAFFENKELNKIREHLEHDVKSEEELFLIMKECGLIN